MSAKLIISFPATERTVHEAKKNFEVHGAGSKNMEISELLELAEKIQADALLISFIQKFPSEILAKIPRSVKVLATCSVGYDHIDIKAATERGLPICNTPDVLTQATADQGMLLLMGAARRLREQMQVMDSGWGRALGQNEMLGLDVTGKRLGILGMGRIGQAMADRARGFGMEILYCNRRRLSPEEEKGAKYFSDFDEMLPHCQILSLHAPSSPETEGIMNATRFAKLPKNAIFVNVARGSLVDERALLDSLNKGHLFAAGLDVFLNEPMINEEIRKHPRILASPHTGSATIETRDAMGLKCLHNISEILAGRKAPDQVLPRT